jgi:CRISPR/Cas system CSM-associated protein Csm3 (group 7 of RAMP superfamily)
VSLAGPWRIGTGEDKPKDGSPVPMLRVAGKPVMPGSGIKGVVRSRAEFIMRSVGVYACPDQRCGAGPCWTCQVFGHGGGQDDSSEAVGRRALIRFADAPLRDPGDPVYRTHVAIDRFTGGARDTALYTLEAIESGAFTLRVEQMRLDVEGELLAQIRAVLRLVLEDLNDGIIGIGAGTARGYGSVSVDLTSPRSGLPDVDEARRVLAGMARDAGLARDGASRDGVSRDGGE